MSNWAGIDYDTRAVHIVLVDEPLLYAAYHRYDLHGSDAFDRCRTIRDIPFARLLEDTVALAIEEPAGHNTRPLNRVQGAILAKLPAGLLVHPLRPSEWRKTLGLPGNSTKDVVRDWCTGHRNLHEYRFSSLDVSRHAWPQDACDAYCLALAVRELVTRQETAA